MNFKFGTFTGDETMTFSVKDEEKLNPGEVLHAVYAALLEKGYNPINQLVGYLIPETRHTLPVTNRLVV